MSDPNAPPVLNWNAIHASFHKTSLEPKKKKSSKSKTKSSKTKEKSVKKSTKDETSSSVDQHDPATEVERKEQELEVAEEEQRIKEQQEQLEREREREDEERKRQEEEELQKQKEEEEMRMLEQQKEEEERRLEQRREEEQANRKDSEENLGASSSSESDSEDSSGSEDEESDHENQHEDHQSNNTSFESDNGSNGESHHHVDEEDEEHTEQISISISEPPRTLQASNSTSSIDSYQRSDSVCSYDDHSVQRDEDAHHSLRDSNGDSSDENNSSNGERSRSSSYANDEDDLPEDSSQHTVTHDSNDESQSHFLSPPAETKLRKSSSGKLSKSTSGTKKKKSLLTSSSGGVSSDGQKGEAFNWGAIHLLAAKSKPTKGQEQRAKEREKKKEEDPEKKKQREEIAKKRMYIAKEILTTERNYVKALNTTVKIFYTPLLQNWQIVEVSSPDVIQRIFGRVDMLLSNHEQFLHGLEDRVGTWTDERMIGDLFLNETDFLLRYTHYVNNYNLALMTLTDCLKIDEFKEFIKKCEASPECHYADLQSFLLEPIQRIPRYEMLLKDLLRKTEASHPDHNNLSKSLQKIEQITKFINEQKRNATEIAKVEAKLTEKVANQLWLANRKYFKEGAVQILVRSKPEPRYLFLFNNLLLICKEEDEIFKVKEKVGIEEDLFVPPFIPKKTASEPTVVTVEISKKKFMFFGPTAEESLLWHKAFEAVKESMKDSGIGGLLKSNIKSKFST